MESTRRTHKSPVLGEEAVNAKVRTDLSRQVNEDDLVFLEVNPPRYWKGSQASNTPGVALYLLFSTRREIRRFLGEFLDLEHPHLLSFFQPFASLFDHFVGQILAGVMPLRIDCGIQPQLGCRNPFIGAVEGSMRVRGQGWLVGFLHGVSS